MGTFDAMTWWRDRLTIAPTPKLVLQALITRIDENDRCYPSQATLAKDCSLSERTVRTALAYLEEVGLITRQRRSQSRGYRTSDSIIVMVGMDPIGLPYEEWLTKRPTASRARGSVEVSYSTARARLVRKRGKASSNTCLECAGPASIWVYRGTGVTLVSPEGYAYSADPRDYDAMCRSCAYDEGPTCTNTKEVSETNSYRQQGHSNRHLFPFQPEANAGEVFQGSNQKDPRDLRDPQDPLIKQDPQDPLPRSRRMTVNGRNYTADVSKDFLKNLAKRLPEFDDDAVFLLAAELAMYPSPSSQDLFMGSPEFDDLSEAVYQEARSRVSG